eukprot:scaffold247618_cov39-Prasinocladus_malaysianus.AAC.2
MLSYELDSTTTGVVAPYLPARIFVYIIATVTVRIDQSRPEVVASSRPDRLIAILPPYIDDLSVSWGEHSWADTSVNRLTAFPVPNMVRRSCRALELAFFPMHAKQAEFASAK